MATGNKIFSQAYVYRKWNEDDRYAMLNMFPFVGLLLGILTCIAWYMLDNPFGINNIYIAVATPALVMLLDSAIGKISGSKVPTEAA